MAEGGIEIDNEKGEACNVVLFCIMSTIFMPIQVVPAAYTPERSYWLCCAARLMPSCIEDALRFAVGYLTAGSMEELDMLAAKNKALAEAAEVIKRMSLGKALRYRYEAYLKAKRDRYGEDEYIRDLGMAEGMAQGRAQGRAEAVIQLLDDMGEIPDALKERIQKETDLQVLGKWLKLAARAESISEFEKKMDDVLKDIC